jgi:hypothetical protein
MPQFCPIYDDAFYHFMQFPVISKIFERVILAKYGSGIHKYGAYPSGKDGLFAAPREKH